MTYIKKLARFIVPYKKYAYLNIFFNVLYALFGTLSFVSLMPMLKVLLKTSERILEKPLRENYDGLLAYGDYLNDSLNYFITDKIATDGQYQVLILMIMVVLSAFLLKNISGYFSNFFLAYLRNGILKDIRNELYEKTVELPVAYFTEKRKGDIIARISTDVNEIQNSLLAILELLVREPLTIIFTIIVMFTISFKLTVFVFVFIPISGLIISRVGKSLKKHSKKVQDENGVFLSILDETINGLKVIKGYNSENRFTTIFKNSTSRLYKFANGLAHRSNLASPTSEFLGIVVIAVILLYGGKMVLVDAVLTPDEFITYMALAYNILTPAKAISKASYKVKAGNASADRVLEILQTTSTLKDSEHAKTKTDFTKGIVIDQINFKYEDELVLDDFSLQIEKGKTVALVGQSGSGKSTIANLVTRFYDINQGSITIDGEDIRNLTKQSLRNLIGLVTQDSILFNDTVKNNIILGKEDATDPEIIDALKVANAWEFVKDLPNGIETNIGDSGNKLSGGQKQRLSIARAVLKNPPIMVLDEATSALDTESERLVQDALENMMKNRTSIVIAHRLSTIQNADTIVVMQKGKIVEQGKHQELLDNNGVYSNLVKMQTLN
jgi:subfamily B ATP-binding cassette protein MsbA